MKDKYNLTYSPRNLQSLPKIVSNTLKLNFNYHKHLFNQIADLLDSIKNLSQLGLNQEKINRKFNSFLCQFATLSQIIELPTEQTKIQNKLKNLATSHSIDNKYTRIKLLNQIRTFKQLIMNQIFQIKKHQLKIRFNQIQNESLIIQRLKRKSKTKINNFPPMIISQDFLDQIQEAQLRYGNFDKINIQSRQFQQCITQRLKKLRQNSKHFQ